MKTILKIAIWFILYITPFIVIGAATYSHNEESVGIWDALVHTYFWMIMITGAVAVPACWGWLLDKLLGNWIKKK